MKKIMVVTIVRRNKKIKKKKKRWEIEISYKCKEWQQNKIGKLT